MFLTILTYSFSANINTVFLINFTAHECDAVPITRGRGYE